MIQPNQAVILEIASAKFQLYVDADHQIRQRFGHSPGAEFLMALTIESEEDATDLADLYCQSLLASR